jgi:multidrug efflux pump subunit AcrA (membrane-fusion protein)
LEEAKLNRLQDQLKNCVIYSPSDGMVVYANEQSRGRFGSNNNSQIEEGAAVRERQSILKIPDLTRMQVKVNVHETKVEDVRPGLRARINIQGRELQGQVTQVANQPEASGWGMGNVKEYATIVEIDGIPQGLKPGMTAEVEILVAHLKDVLTLPVAALSSSVASISAGFSSRMEPSSDGSSSWA